VYKRQSQSSEFCRHNPLGCFSTSVYCCLFYQLSPETFGYIHVHAGIFLTTEEKQAKPQSGYSGKGS